MKKVKYHDFKARRVNILISFLNMQHEITVKKMKECFLLKMTCFVESSLRFDMMTVFPLLLNLYITVISQKHQFHYMNYNMTDHDDDIVWFWFIFWYVRLFNQITLNLCFVKTFHIIWHVDENAEINLETIPTKISNMKCT